MKSLHALLKKRIVRFGALIALTPLLFLLFQNMSLTGAASSCSVAAQLNIMDNVAQFCDGSKYESMKKNVIGSCAAAGQVAMSGSDVGFCDGTQIWSIRGPSIGTCSTNGQIGWNGATPTFCLSGTLYASSTPTYVIQQAFAQALGRQPTSGELSSLLSGFNVSAISYADVLAVLQQAVSQNANLLTASDLTWTVSGSSWSAQITACSNGLTLQNGSCTFGTSIRNNYYSQMINDMNSNFWNSSGSHIEFTRQNAGWARLGSTSTDVWQMAQYANVLYWDWKLTQSSAARAKLQAQWSHMLSEFTVARITSAADADGIVHWSDDGAWELNYLVQTYEVTGDTQALTMARTLLPNLLARFADPNNGGVGILYALESGSGHDGVSTSYEAMIASSAVAIYKATGDIYFLNYAEQTYKWIKAYMKHPTRNYYYCELDIFPVRNGVTNTHYRVPIGDYYGVPVRGNSTSYSGGTMAMRVLAARLYAITNDSSYLTEAQSINQSLLTYFVRPGNLFVNERDPWTDAYWTPYYVSETVPLTGVDPKDGFKTVIRSTAMNIALNARTSSGWYSAEWSGPEDTNYPNFGGAITYIEQSGWSGTDQAAPGQIMTSSESAAMISAAAIVETLKPANASGVLPGISPDTSAQACFYSEKNYGGNSVCYSGQWFTAFDMQNGMNDRTMSVKITGNISLQICIDVGLGGECHFLPASTADITQNFGSTWASAVSSARSFVSTPGETCIFSDANYQGSSLCYHQGDVAPTLPGGWNDVVSSIRITGFGPVTLCSDINLKGTCQTYTSSISYVGDTMNDKASSLKVAVPNRQ